jgi:hypothetical protein
MTSHFLSRKQIMRERDRHVNVTNNIWKRKIFFNACKYQSMFFYSCLSLSVSVYNVILFHRNLCINKFIQNFCPNVVLKLLSKCSLEIFSRYSLEIFSEWSSEFFSEWSSETTIFVKKCFWHYCLSRYLILKLLEQVWL